MAYVSREIVDRVAVGDDCYTMVGLPDGRVRLVPTPDSVTVGGTPINKELLQLMEDRIVYLMNRVFDDISSNPFMFTFNNLSGLKVTGVWNDTLDRIEC